MSDFTNRSAFRGLEKSHVCVRVKNFKLNPLRLVPYSLLRSWIFKSACQPLCMKLELRCLYFPAVRSVGAVYLKILSFEIKLKTALKALPVPKELPACSTAVVGK